MSSSYKFNNPEGIYFISFATVEWVDVFTRPIYKNILIDSFKHCQKEKGLLIYAWCIMSNHLHLIVASDGKFKLSDIVRDFKKFTSTKIIKQIQGEAKESRRNWMLWLFKEAGRRNSNNVHFQFWQQDSHPVELISNKFMDQKLNYIHHNPVVTGIVENPEEYLYSSARDYAGSKGLLELVLIE